jgi:HEPN domain-containing protein
VLNEEDAKQAIECAEAIRNFITSLVPEIKDIPDV